MGVYLRAKFEVSSIIITSSKRTPKKSTQIRVTVLLLLLYLKSQEIKYFIFPQIQQKFNPLQVYIERNGLQHLSGYVVHKFLKKIKKKSSSTDNKKIRSQSLLNILFQIIPKLSNQLQKKGGLIAVKDELLSLFTVTEEML